MRATFVLCGALALGMLGCAGPIATSVHTSGPSGTDQPSSPPASALPRLPTVADVEGINPGVLASLPPQTLAPDAALPEASDDPSLERALAVTINGSQLSTGTVAGQEVAVWAPQLYNTMAGAGIDPTAMVIGFATDPLGAAQVRISALAVQGLTGAELAGVVSLASTPGLQDGTVEGKDVSYIVDPATYFYVSDAALFVLQGPPEEVVAALLQLP